MYVAWWWCICVVLYIVPKYVLYMLYVLFGWVSFFLAGVLYTFFYVHLIMCNAWTHSLPTPLFPPPIHYLFTFYTFPPAPIPPSPHYAVTPFTERMIQMGFTSKEIRESLLENRYDEVCATYMLLKRDLGNSNVSPVHDVYAVRYSFVQNQTHIHHVHIHVAALYKLPL